MSEITMPELFAENRKYHEAVEEFRHYVPGVGYDGSDNDEYEGVDDDTPVTVTLPRSVLVKGIAGLDSLSTQATLPSFATDSIRAATEIAKAVYDRKDEAQWSPEETENWEEFLATEAALTQSEVALA